MRRSFARAVIVATSLIAPLASAAPALADEVPGGAPPEAPAAEPAAAPADDLPKLDLPPEEGAAPAEGKSADLSDVVKSEEDFFALEQVVVAASKRAQRIEDAPARITVISGEDIRRYGFRTVAEVLKIVPEWHVVDNRDFSFANTRGVLFTGNFNTRILVLVDGHSQAETWGASSAISDDLGIDMSQVERIEILQGPGSSLYGTNAFFGLVNVVTRDPSGKGPFGGLDFGSYGRVKALVGDRRKIGDNLAYELSLRGVSTDGTEFFFPERQADSLGGHSRPETDRERDYSLFGKVTYGDLRLVGKAALRQKHAPTASYGAIFNDDRTRFDAVAGFVDARWSRELTKGWRLNLRGYWDKYSYDDFLPYSEDGGYLFRDEGDTTWTGEEAQIDVDAYRGKNTALRLFLGEEAQYSWTKTHIFTVGDDPADEIKETKNFLKAAAYAQAEVTLYDRLLLIGGARYDYDSVFEAAVSPRGAVIYHPQKSTTLKAIYNRGFRNPSIYEQFFDDDDQILAPYSILHAETIDTAELVVEQSVEERVSATAGTYWFRGRQLFGERRVKCFGTNAEVEGNPRPPAGFLGPCGNAEDENGAPIARGLDDETVEPAGTKTRKQFTNSGAFGGIGGDVAVKYRDGEGRRAFANVTVQTLLRSGNLNNDAAEEPVGAPQLMANVGVSHPLWRERLFVSGTVNFIGARVAIADPHVSLPPYALVNARLLYRQFLQAFDVAVTAYNLLDRRYEEVVAAESIEPIRSVPQESRTFMLSISYNN